MTPVRLTLIGKPGCHLCDDARAVVTRVVNAVRDASRGRGQVAIEFEELNILEDEGLATLHSEYIPVVLINGTRHGIWYIDEGKLTDAVEKAARKWRILSAFDRKENRS